MFHVKRGRVRSRNATGFYLGPHRFELLSHARRRFTVVIHSRRLAPSLDGAGYDFHDDDFAGGIGMARYGERFAQRPGVFSDV